MKDFLNKMMTIPLKITKTVIDSVGKRTLRPGWKSWFCPKCGVGWVYRGKRPKHKKCDGHITVVNIKECEDELVECMIKEIKKDVIKDEKRKPLIVWDSICEVQHKT